MITSRGDFENELQKIDRSIDRRAALPDQVFVTRPVAFHVVDFDQFWSEEFFGDAQRLTRRAGDDSFTFAVLRPDPDSYYHAHFGKFPMLRFSDADPAHRYIEELHRDPGGSPADAIAFNSEVVLLYPPSRRWAMYGDRNLEIAVVAVMDEEIEAGIRQTTHSLRLFTPTEAATELLSAVYRGAVPEEVKRSLVRNYEPRVITG
ncbi:MAG TPA: hypothetical protein VF824_08505 [Thermoanaerobaculia bacterium]|jgi:hypothetical protein